MKTNFPHFLMNAAMFEMSCDPMISKMFLNNKKTSSR